MSWFTANRTRRIEPRSSFEGRIFSGIIRNEPDLAKAMKQAEYDNSISKVTVDRLLPKLSEIDLRADRAAYIRAINSGDTKEQAMELVIKLRNRRMMERSQKTAMISAVKKAS